MDDQNFTSKTLFGEVVDHDTYLRYTRPFPPRLYPSSRVLESLFDVSTRMGFDDIVVRERGLHDPSLYCVNFSASQPVNGPQIEIP